MSLPDQIEALFSDDAKRARQALAHAQALEVRVEELETEVAELRKLITEQN